MAKLFANSGDPDQMPHSAASDLGLHCLPVTFYGYLDYSGLKKCFIWSYECCVIFNKTASLL